VAARQPFSATDYHHDPRRRARGAFVRAAGHLLRPLGFDLELRDYYSPIPRAGDRPADWWEQPGDLPGVALDLEAQLAFIETELAPALAEFRPPSETADPYVFPLDNGLFSGGDADLLYAIVRRFRSRRILELGAGFSTLVAARAAAANTADGHPSELISCDPYAVPPPPGAVPGLAELRPVAAQDVPLVEYEALEAGDVLFIDSSHTVKVGGDVVHLLGEVLPRLRPGVLVHLHDIYLPWPYPRAWVARARWYWAEQYLLQALLCDSAAWEVLAGAFALSRLHGPELQRLIPNLSGSPAPLSFWLRRAAA
jgi:hypothetical protein